MQRAVMMVAVFLVGCGDSTALSIERGEGDSFVRQGAVTAEPTLVFDAAWNESASAALQAGGAFVVDYAPERLPECRASHNGNPGWQITAFARFSPGGTISQADLFTYEQGVSGPDYHTWVRTTPRFTVPEGTTGVELWFRNGSGFDRPCERWDSNFEQNYRFEVVSSTVGELLFQSDWRNVLSGAVVRGGVMRVRYAPERMQSIVRGATLSGVPYFAARYHCYGYGCCSYAYDTRAHVRFRPDQPFSDEPIGDRALEYTVPGDATRVEVFFHTDVTTSTWYCGGDESRKATQGPDRFYDSNYGANYQLTLP